MSSIAFDKSSPVMRRPSSQLSSRTSEGQESERDHDDTQQHLSPPNRRVSSDSLDLANAGSPEGDELADGSARHRRTLELLTRPSASQNMATMKPTARLLFADLGCLLSSLLICRAFGPSMAAIWSNHSSEVVPLFSLTLNGSSGEAITTTRRKRNSLRTLPRCATRLTQFEEVENTLSANLMPPNPNLHRKRRHSTIVLRMIRFRGGMIYLRRQSLG